MLLAADHFQKQFSDPTYGIRTAHALHRQGPLISKGFSMVSALSKSTADSIEIARMGYQSWANLCPLPIRLVHSVQDSFLGLSARVHAANADFIEHYNKPVQRVPLNLSNITIDGQNIEAAEKSVKSEDFYNITHIERTNIDGSALDRIDPKVILFVPASGHNKSLLEDTIRELAPSHETYIFEVQDAAQIPKDKEPFPLDSFIDATIEANRVVTMHDPYHGRIEGPVRANNLAVCQPGPGVLVGLALMSERNDPARPITFTALASPIDTSIAPTSTNEFAHSKPMEWFEREVISEIEKGLPGEGREAYGAYLQRWAFLMKNSESIRNHLTRFRQFHSDLLDGNEDSVAKKISFDDVFFKDISSLDGTFYLDTVRHIFKDNAIGNGVYMYRGQPVDTRKIKDIAMIAADGTHDDVCGFDAQKGVGQTSALLNITPGVSDDNKAHGVFEAGHYMFAGSAFKNDVGPWAFDQIRQFDQQLGYTSLPAESLPKPKNMGIAHTREAA